MRLHGPLHGDFYLSFDQTLQARAAGDGVLLRVIGSRGYPHDLRVAAEPALRLRSRRVFAPVISAGEELRLEVAEGDGNSELSGAFKILCANCFAEIWSSALPAQAGAAEVGHTEEAFWSDPERPGCPRCFAAAARAH